MAIHSEKFSGAEVAHYDQRIQGLVPGYQTLQEITPAVLVSRVPKNARILVVGAGSAAEILALAATGSDWSITGIDPSPDMLNLARRKIETNGLSDRVQLQTTDLAHFRPEVPFDAAVSLLVAHFIPDDGAKDAFVDDLARCLKPDAPLLLGDLTEWALEPDNASYRHWASARGKSPTEVDAMFTRMVQNFHPIGEQRLAVLLAEKGFRAPQCYFQALSVRAFLTYREAQAQPSSR